MAVTITKSHELVHKHINQVVVFLCLAAALVTWTFYGILESDKVKTTCNASRCYDDGDDLCDQNVTRLWTNAQRPVRYKMGFDQSFKVHVPLPEFVDAETAPTVMYYLWQQDYNPNLHYGHQMGTPKGLTVQVVTSTSDKAFLQVSGQLSAATMQKPATGTLRWDVELWCIFLTNTDPAIRHEIRVTLAPRDEAVVGTCDEAPASTTYDNHGDSTLMARHILGIEAGLLTLAFLVLGAYLVKPWLWSKTETSPPNASTSGSEPSET